MWRVMNNPIKVGVYSFGVKGDPNRGAEIHYVWDATKYRDAFSNGVLRRECTSGRDNRVQAWIQKDDRYAAIMDSVIMLVADAHAMQASWISVGFADHHGEWTAVALAELAAKHLKSQEANYHVQLVHKGLSAYNVH